MAFLSTYRDAGPLTHLSLTRDGVNPTNAERLRQFRECVPPALANAYPRSHLSPKRAGVVIPFRRTA